MEPYNLKLVCNENYYHFSREQIQQATKEIIVSAFEFDCLSNSPASFGYTIFSQLSEKKEKGLKIVVYLNSSNKSNRMFFVNRNTFEKLFQIGIEVHMTPRSRTLHAKFMIFDSYKILLGSHNISDKSVRRCKETSLYIESVEIAEQLKNFLKVVFT